MTWIDLRRNEGRCPCDAAQIAVRAGSTMLEDESPMRARHLDQPTPRENPMNRIVYIVGAIVIIVFLLGFLGLR